MHLQKQSKLYNHFQSSEGELPIFHLIRYAPVVVTERKNVGFQNKI